jgi:hypothetical protein
MHSFLVQQTTEENELTISGVQDGLRVARRHGSSKRHVRNCEREKNPKKTKPSKVPGTSGGRARGAFSLGSESYLIIYNNY